ncbi:MAG TPA: TIGR03118 family protein [Verrucomicrobiae bacterium]|nr:TIGR03118 family protein [Verrucomicrobiae bacterium]
MNKFFGPFTFLKAISQRNRSKTGQRNQACSSWLFGLSLAVWLGLAGTASAMTTNVVFQNFSFTPQTVSIQVGDTVVWTNAGGFHTVTGDGTDPFCGPNAVATTCSETFTNAGTFPYHCNFHQFLGMVGTVIVNGGNTNTNPPPDTNRILDPIPAKIPKGSLRVDLQTVASGLVAPIGMAVPDDGSGRQFVYDQIGLVYVIQNGKLLPNPLLDVRARLVQINPGYDERGLVGLALHTNFAQFPFVYTYTSEPNGPTADFPITYTDGNTNDHQQVIAEWKIDSADPNRVDIASRREILRLDKPQFNHNGGTMRFGPDGFLYFGVGDGGAADDQGPGHSPGGNGQDTTKILGKINRIDVDARTSANGQYGVPTDNPFVGQAGFLPEIYAFGFRNPYSFSFDLQTGDLYVGDVGQNDVEEVDKVVKGGNFGWSVKEGSFYFDANGTNDGFVTSVPQREVPPGLIDPIAEYDHDEGDAIIGGFLYRGEVIRGLAGKYVTGDLGTTNLGRLFYVDGGQMTEFLIGSTDRPMGIFLKGFGQDADGELYVLGSTNLGPSGSAGKVMKIVPLQENTFVQRNLVSDQPGQADLVDTNLVNAWGLAFSSTSPFWISDNHTGLSTLYNSTGGVQALVVTIPTPPGATGPSAPSGVIFNGTTNFTVGGKASRFIFATEDGTIAAWGSGTNAVLAVDNSASGAVYKGLAVASNQLYAANFHAGTVDVFDGKFAPVVRAGAFVDPDMPTNYAPFNIAPFNNKLYVTYAQQDSDAHDDTPGPGHGFIDVYDLNGNLTNRLITAGPLNSPWGMAMAPLTFGAYPGAFLVGNFGDGAINAFDPATGAFLGRLADATGTPITINGLWAIEFGNGGQGGDPNVLYFTAGPAGETHGLFGSIAPANYLRIMSVSRNPGGLALTLVGGTPPYLIQQKTSLADSTWSNLVTTTNLGIVLSMTNSAAFFRVIDHAPATP